jgi:uncharacterized protein
VTEPPFWERPLHALAAAEWEALCDGCGRCCLHKLEDEDTGELAWTCVACRLLDCGTGRCSDYANRHRKVPDCVALTPDTASRYAWLPPSCAYRLRAAGQPLPEWHPLRSGDPASVVAAGASVAGRVFSESELGRRPLEAFTVDWPGQWPRAARPRARRGPA